jgi:anti-sigma factor RsiW
MNCTQARAFLPALVYGDLPSTQAAAVEKHLDGCPSCREERHAVREVRRLLDATRAPAVEVNVPRLYQDAAARQERSARRWRRAAVALLATAALALLVLVLRLEVRWQAGQVTLRWGTPEVAPDPSPFILRDVPRPEPKVVPLAPEEVQLLKDLIHALAADAEGRDQQQYLHLQRMQARLDALQMQSEQRWNALERDIAALYTAQFGGREKGEKP